MEKCNYRKDPHQDIDHVFRDLLPAHGMVERPAQVELSHQMLDTMLNGSIALCDAGTGIGKTYAYLVAGVVFRRYRSRAGLPNQPLLISTSSIADVVGFSFPQHCSERTVQHTISHHDFGEERKVIVDDRTLECDAGGGDQQGLVRQAGT